MSSTLRKKIEKNACLREYVDLINKIAKVEFKAMNCQHVIEFPELVNIGIHTVNMLFEANPPETYNNSYITTAIKWAIRNELRRRYKWHSFKFANAMPDEEDKAQIREAVYKTILSTDEMMSSDAPIEVKDSRRTPEEVLEFSQMAEAIKEAMKKLPQRERDLIYNKFFSEKKLAQLSDEFNISPSRISRIIQSGLDKIKKELVKEGMA